MTYAENVLVYITRNPGVTAVDIANLFPVESKIYGRQRAASSAIAFLRKEGLLMDVARCECCHRAQTRGQRNVRLYATAKAKGWE